MNLKTVRIKIFAVLCFLCIGLASSQSALAQSEEMAVADNVSELEKQLSATSFEDRDAAEKALIEFGSKALDHLSDPSPDLEDDLNARLTRIRKKLEKVAIDETITPSKITLSGAMSIKKALGEIEAQSGNTIELEEGYDPTLLDKQIAFDLTDASFWTAYSQILSRGGFVANAYGGISGKAIIVPAPPVNPAEVDQVGKRKSPPLDQSSIFRIQVASVSSVKNLLTPGLDYTRVNLEIEWEPRLNPITIDMPLSELKVTDADGGELKVSNPQQVLSGPVQDGINQIEMSITLENVDREIKSIGSITGTLDCILPGRQEKFRFPPLKDIEDKPKISKAGMTVQYMGFEKNEDLYAVGVTVTMDAEAGSFDSHLGWVYDNPLFLIDEVGKKEPSIGQQGGDIDGNGVIIQYFFIDDPSARGLLYESPGAIVPFPATFNLKEIPLP